MNKCPVLLLDLGGVVFTGPVRHSDTIDWDIIHDLNETYAHDLNIGQDVFDNFITDYNDRVGKIMTQQEFLTELFNTLHYNEELISFAREHFQVIIASDNYRENIEFINRRYDLTSWTEDQFYSYDFQMTKEDPRFFEMLLDQLSVSPDTFIFLDDSTSKLVAAEKTGIQGIHHTSNATSIAALKRFLSR